MRSFFVGFNAPVGRDAEIGECSRGQQIDDVEPGDLKILQLI